MGKTRKTPTDPVTNPVTDPVTNPVTNPVTPQVAPQVTPQVTALLRAMTGDMDRQQLQQALNLRARKNFRLLYLDPALEAGLIERTLPDKPTSRLQKYRLTEKGRRLSVT